MYNICIFCVQKIYVRAKRIENGEKGVLGEGALPGKMLDLGLLKMNLGCVFSISSP